MSRAPKHGYELVASLTSAVASQDELLQGNNVLVVDDFALGVLNSVLSHNAILKAGFLTVCPFESKKQLAASLRRRPYSSFDVLYLCRPKKSNLARIIDDYRVAVDESPPDLWERFLSRFFPCVFGGIPVLEPEPAMYADARLLTLSGPQQRPGVQNWQLALEFVQSQIEGRGRELDRLKRAWKTDSPTKECPVEFMAYEDSLFSLDMHDTLSIVYTHALSAGSLEEEELEAVREKVFEHLDTVAQRLMTAIVCMNEFPFVRFTHSDRGISEVVARSLVRQLKTYRDSHPGFRPWGDPRAYDEDLGGMGSRVLRPGEPPEPATVIIVDRVDDLAPVLMNDIGYASLVQDLLGHELGSPLNFKYAKKGEVVEKDVLLDNSDPVWRILQHSDMGAVIDAVNDGVRAANERAERRRQLDASDVGDLRELMSALAGDEVLVSEKFSLHYRMKQAIVESYEQRNFHELVELQQILATGCDDAGVHVSSKVVETSMRTMMRDERLTSEDQARLIALFILCAKSVDAKLRAELMALSHISPAHARALLNLSDVHVPLARTASQPRPEAGPFMDDDTLKRNKKAALDAKAKRLCRYVSKAEDICKNALDGSLPEDVYPWVRPPPAKGAVSTLDARQLSSAVAMHGAHGEVVNKYTAEALSAAGGAEVGKVKGARQKKSRWVGSAGDLGGGAGGGAGGASGSTGGSAVAADDPLARYFEPPRPRLYEGGRIVVFVVGGVTQGEVAALARLSLETNREIIVGGTSVLMGRDVLEQLEACDPGGGDEGDEDGFAPSVENF